jgi:hypothetical protein
LALDPLKDLRLVSPKYWKREKRKMGKNWMRRLYGRSERNERPRLILFGKMTRKISSMLHQVK